MFLIEDEMTDVIANLDKLIDMWCERRALRPLQLLFRAYPGPLAHTDQLHDLLDSLRDVKGLCRNLLTEEELTLVIETLNALEDSLRRY